MKNMLTYFVRHTQLSIDDDTFKTLWRDNRVAIHFPEDRTGWSEEDSRSIDPNDYGDRGARRSLSALNDLAQDGGYVCAVYAPHPGQCKVGFVEPESTIELINGRYDTTDRTAVLKTIPMLRVRTLTESDSIVLLVGRPRQGTICRWKAIGNRVQLKVDNLAHQVCLEDLTPNLQEVMCAEFLRLPIASALRLPRVQTLLLPVGRTMRDIDIIGVDSEGNRIVAQVTYSHTEHIDHKRHALRQYVNESPTTRAVMFCDTSENEFRDGIYYFPIRETFRLFCEQTSLGRRWLNLVT